MAWVGSGHTKWTHGQLWVKLVTEALLLLLLLLVLLQLHPFSGLFSRTTWLSRYQKGKPGLNLNKARADVALGWQRRELDHMQTIRTNLITQFLRAERSS